jgi:flagellar biosynthesis protein FlhG
MKRIEDQSYYEILEVSHDATVKEIQQAYEHAKETFHFDSLAVYSLFSEEEMKKIQASVEEAYRVLMDEALRRSYDQSHSHLIERSPREKQAEKLAQPSEVKGSLSFTDLSLEIGEMPYRGKSLKQIREKLGIELKAISTETKINIKTLEWIEEENLDCLPAPVYLKGFLKAYARALNLDSQKLIEGYLRLIDEREKK